MPKEQRCPKCGAELSAFATEGFCSACLLERGLSSAPWTGVLPLSRFGDYELIEEIARGGMGVVYKARQVSLDRIVAVKMILSGQFAGAAEMQRFRAEARAAASLQHPNIVAIHEVGEHEGLLFFSMDYVEGHHLGQLVREGPLPSLPAARCVEKIARAVHHAHEQGVLHRDLKPSNVLLDAQDEPHVTDFGLAKRLTDSALETRHSELTLSGQVLGTPSFMPPEQAAGQRDQMGPRSDVYSLGAILYHLLTARPPFVGADVHTLLAQVINAEVVTPRLLNPTTPRDLETIALKCLEKEPSRRYESALALAEELSRHLNHEPIHALPPSTIYRARKFVRRNRMAVAAAACFALVLTAASIVSTVFGLRAKDESGRAVKALKESEEARNQAEAVSKFMMETLRRPDPAIDGREVKVVDLLDQSAKDLQENFSGPPKIKADILEALGQTYEGLDLGSNAVPLFETARNLRLAEFGPTNRGTLRLGTALANLQPNSERTNVIALYEETLAGQRAALGSNDPDTLKTMAELGHTYQWLCRVPGNTVQWSNAAIVRAEALMREAMERGRAHLAPDHPCLLYCVSGLGQFYSTANQFTNALPLLQEAVRLQQARLPKDHPELLGSKTLLAGVLFDLGQTNEAVAMYQDAVAGCLRKLGPGHKRTMDAIFGASWAYYRLRRWTDQVQLLDDFLQMRRLHNVPDSRALLLLERLAKAFDGLGQNAEALRVTQEALELGKSIHGSDDPDTLRVMRYLGTFQERAGRSDDALRLREQTLELSKTRLGLGAPETHRAMWQLGASYFNADRRDEALPLLQDMLKLLLANPTSTQSELMKGIDTSINSVAAKLIATNQLVEAEQLLRELLKLQQKRQAASGADSINTRHLFGSVYQKTGRFEEGRVLFQDLLKLQTTTSLAPDQPLRDKLMSIAVNEFADALLLTNRFVEAEQLLRDLLSVQIERKADAREESAETRVLLAQCLLGERKFAVAEEQARKGHSMLAKLNPERSHTFDAQSLLGDILTAQGQFEAAQKPLLEAQEKLAKLVAEDPIPSRVKFLSKATERIVRLYEEWGKVGEAAPWKEKLMAVKEAERRLASNEITAPSLMPPLVARRTNTTTIDLSGFCNAPLNTYWLSAAGGVRSISNLLAGERVLGGVDYDIRGVVQLFGTPLQEPGRPAFPAGTNGIPVGRAATHLHFLLGTAWPESDGRQIGFYVVHFADGQEVEIPLAYGDHVRDWSLRGDRETKVKSGQLVAARRVEDYGVYRVFSFRWENPRPSVEIRSLDFNSNLTESAPFLLAITAEQ